MNPVFAARRRADEFNSMVETTAELRDTRYADDLAPLEALVTSLRATPAPQARPEFVADLRTRLMLAAETVLTPDTAAQSAARRTPVPARTGRERRLAVAVGGFAIVSASASMAVAAESSLPGDTLYPLKRAIESVQESVIRDADDKGATMLGNASGRLDEVDELSRTGDQDPVVISQTLEDFADQAVEASDLLLGEYAATGRASSIDELRTFTSSSLDALQRLEALVPIGARSSLIEAARILDEIKKQVDVACPACADLKVTSAPLDALKDLGEIFGGLLEQPLEQAAPPSKPTTVKPNPVTTDPAPAVDPVAVDPPADEKPPAEETTPPALPGGEGPGQQQGDLIKDLTAGLGSDDPVGDLLTGVLDTASGLLGGGSGGKK